MKIFISIKNFISEYGVGKTKTHELIKDGVLITGKVGRKTVILNASALDFAEKSLQKGNLENIGAQAFSAALLQHRTCLCHTHSSQPADQIVCDNSPISANSKLSRAGTPQKILKENFHG